MRRLASLYGATRDVAALLDALLARVLDAAASRPEPLRQLDDAPTSTPSGCSPRA